MLWPALPPRRILRYRRRGVAGPDALDELARDEAAMRRASAGDVTGFNELVDRYQAPVFNLVLRTVRDASLAEDITQETFLRAWQASAQFRGGSVKGWLMRIAVNRAYDALRTRKRRPAGSLDVLDYEPVPRWSTQSASEDPEQFAARGELSGVIEGMLARLPDDQRTAMLLVDLNGFSYEEAAAIMHVAPGTIKSRISRGRSRLREEIHDDPHLLELFSRHLRHTSEDS